MAVDPVARDGVALESVADSGSDHPCLPLSRSRAHIESGLRGSCLICSDHNGLKARRNTRLVVAALNGSEHGKALDELPDACLGCWICNAPVTVERSACIRDEHRTFEPGPHAKPPNDRQPGRLR